MSWFDRHPLVWRVTLILLCIFVIGFVEAQDRELFKQARPHTEATR